MNAPKVNKKRRLGLAIAGLLSVFVVAPAVILFQSGVWSASRSSERYERDLRAKGYFATEDEYWDSISVNNDQNAASDLRPILARLRTKDRKDENLEGLKAFVKAEQETIRQLDELTSKKEKAVFGKHSVAEEFAHEEDYMGMRDLAVKLCGSASLERIAGRSDNAIRHWKIVARLADYADDHQTILGTLVRIKLTRILNKFVREEDKRQPFSSDEAAQLISAISPLNKPIDYQSAVKAEHLKYVSAFDSPELSKFVSAEGDKYLRNVGRLPMVKSAFLARVNQGFSEYEAQTSSGDLDKVQAGLAKLEEFGNQKGFTYRYLSMIQFKLKDCGKAYVAEQDIRRKLFADLEKRAGTSKKSI